MTKTFLGKKLLVITAHPDDEHLIAGTMYANYKAGGQTALICATLGERGKSHFKKEVTDAEIKKIRKAELMKAGKVLHVGEIVVLHFPDGGLKPRERELYREVLAAAQRIAPDYILSFGPDGISAHWDHIVVGKVARRVARRLKVPIASFTFHPEIARHRHKMLLVRRKFGIYAPIKEFRKGDIKIKIEAGAKRKAMSAHRSQLKDGGWVATLPKRVGDKFFREEYFVSERV